jgi:hypothetical protein
MGTETGGTPCCTRHSVAVCASLFHQSSGKHQGGAVRTGKPGRSDSRRLRRCTNSTASAAFLSVASFSAAAATIFAGLRSEGGGSEDGDWQQCKRDRTKTARLSLAHKPR